MIIKRKLQKKVHPKDLYFVSPLDNLSGEYIYPSVPNNLFTRNKWEDWKTKRISLFPTIQGALMNLSSQGTSLKGKVLVVYGLAGGNPESLIKPQLQDSPTSQGTGEYWYLSSAKLKEITKIEVLKKNGEKIIFHYGPRSTTGYLEGWEWKEILKPWEKEGKLEEKEFGIVSDIYHSGIPRTYKKYVERFKENASSAKYNIDHFRGDTPGLAHEIGHVMNYESKNPITKIHNKIANKYVNDIRDYEPKEHDNILSGVKNYFKQKSLIKEESNASRKGLKLLRKLGYSEDKQKLAKEELRDSLNTYKLGGEISYKSPLAIKIQIPSRRNSTYNKLKKSINNRNQKYDL